MDEKFKQLIAQLKELNLSDKKYAVFGSGSMAVRNIKQANDLDVFVSDDVYQELAKKYNESVKYNESTKKNFNRIVLGEIEICKASDCGYDDPSKVLERAEIIEGVRFVSLAGTILWKKKMARVKDIKHIKMIEDYLAINPQGVGRL